MIFETHTICPRFERYIEAIFHYKGFQPDHSIERVVPTGHVYLIFELDGFERHTFDNTTLEPVRAFSKAWISGMHEHYLSISAHADSEMFVVQFKAGGAYPFLQFGLDSITNEVVAGLDIPGGQLLALHGDLYAAGTSADKFAVVDGWLQQRYRGEFSTPDSLLDVIVRFQNQPTAKLADIVDDYAGTQKHLIDQFKKYVGITPKTYQRILRFNEIFAQIQGQESPNWSAIAHICGYSDQSHFIREFRRFSGFNPGEFLADELNQEEPNFFPLDRDG